MKLKKIIILTLAVSILFNVVQWNNMAKYRKVMERETFNKVTRIYSISEDLTIKIQEMIRKGYTTEEGIAAMKYEASLLVYDLYALRDYAGIFGVDLLSNFAQYGVQLDIGRIMVRNTMVEQDGLIPLDEHSKESFKSVNQTLNYIVGVIKSYSVHENEEDIDNWSKNILNNWTKIIRDLSEVIVAN